MLTTSDSSGIPYDKWLWIRRDEQGLATSMPRAALNSNGHYTDRGDEYFAQREVARSDRLQALRATLFQDVADERLTILDFGCGNGGILTHLPARARIGVEIGEQAASDAQSKGITIHRSLAEVAPRSIDVAISFHAIEHVEHPLDALSAILRTLKPGGKARLVVPCETPITRMERGWKTDKNQHLYTWTPLLFGNLAARAGFEQIEARLAPMPSGARMARWVGTKSLLGRAWSTFINLRDNSYNVVLDAVAPSSRAS